MDPAAVLRNLHLRRVSCTSSAGSDSPLPSGSSDHAGGHGVATFATKTPSLQDLKYNEQRAGNVADSLVNRHHSATSLPSYSPSSLSGTLHSPLHAAVANSFHAAPTHPCSRSETQVLAQAPAAGAPVVEDAAARTGTAVSTAGAFASNTRAAAAALAAVLPEFKSAAAKITLASNSCGDREAQGAVTLSPVGSAAAAYTGGAVSAPLLRPEEAEFPLLQEQLSRGSGGADAGAWAGRSGSPSRWVLPEGAVLSQGRSRRRSLELHISRLRRSSVDAGSSCGAGPAHAPTAAPATHPGVGTLLGHDADSDGGSDAGLPLGDTPTAAGLRNRSSAAGFGALDFTGSHSGSGGAGRCREASGGGARPAAAAAVAALPSRLAAAGVADIAAHAGGGAVGELLQQQPHGGVVGAEDEVAALRAERGRLLCELQAAHAREMALAEQLGRARAEALELRQQLAQQQRAAAETAEAEAGRREEAQRSKADAHSEARRWRSKAAAAEEQLQTARAQLACLRAAAATDSATGTGAPTSGEPPLASQASAREAATSRATPGPVAAGAATGAAEAAAVPTVPPVPGWAAHLTARVAVGAAGSGGSSPWLGGDAGSSGVDSPLLVSRTPSYGTPRHPATVSAAGLAAVANSHGGPQTGAVEAAAATELAPAPGAGNWTCAPACGAAEARVSSGVEAGLAWGRVPLSADRPAPTVIVGPGPGAAGDLRRSASDLCLHIGEASPHSIVAETWAQAATAPTAASGYQGTAAKGSSGQPVLAAASSAPCSADAAASAGPWRTSEVSPFNANGPGAEAAAAGGRRLAPAAAFSGRRPGHGTVPDTDPVLDSSTHTSSVAHSSCRSPLPSSRSVPDPMRPAPGPQRPTSPTPAPPRPAAARISLSAAVAAAVSTGSPSRPASAGGGPPGCTPQSSGQASASASAPASSAPFPLPHSCASHPAASRHLGAAPPQPLLCDAADTNPSAARGTRTTPSDVWPGQPPLHPATAPSSGDGWPDGWSLDLAVVAAAAAVSNGLHSQRRPPLAAPGRPRSPPAPTTGPVHARAPECLDPRDAERGCNGGGGSSSFGPGGNGSPRAAALGMGRGAVLGVMRRSAPGTAASLSDVGMESASSGFADMGWGAAHGGGGACGGGGGSTVQPASAVPPRVSASGLVRYDSDGVVLASASGSAVSGDGRAVTGGGAVGAEQGHQGQDLGSRRQGGAGATQGRGVPDCTTTLHLNDNMGHGRGSAVGPQGAGGARDAKDEVDRLRQAGNRAYSCGQHSLACHCYTTALELLLGRTYSSGAAGAVAAAVAASCGAGGEAGQAGAGAADPRVIAVLYCNRAAALLAAGSYTDAVADCCAASAYDGQYARAWQRRSEALAALGAFAAAAAALQRCVELIEAAEAEPPPQPPPNGAAATCTGPSSGSDTVAATAASRLSALRTRLADLRKLSHASGTDAGAGLSAAGRLAAALAPGSASAAAAAAAAPVVDYYAVLRLPGPEADAADVRKAYRRLALQYHPDKAAAAAGGEAGTAAVPGSENDAGSGGAVAARAAAAAAAVVFPLVAEAYGVLSNPSSRRLYDIRRARGLGSRGRGVALGSGPGLGRPRCS